MHELTLSRCIRSTLTARIETTRTESGDSSTKVSHNWCPGIAHLTLDRDLCLHIHLANPCSQNGDDRTWDDKHGVEVHNGETFYHHRDTDLDEPREGVRYRAIDWEQMSSHSGASEAKLTGTDVSSNTSDDAGRRGRVKPSESETSGSLQTQYGHWEHTSRLYPRQLR